MEIDSILFSSIEVTQGYVGPMTYVLVTRKPMTRKKQAGCTIQFFRETFQQSSDNNLQ